MASFPSSTTPPQSFLTPHAVSFGADPFLLPLSPTEILKKKVKRMVVCALLTQMLGWTEKPHPGPEVSPPAVFSESLGDFGSSSTAPFDVVGICEVEEGCIGTVDCLSMGAREVFDGMSQPSHGSFVECPGHGDGLGDPLKGTGAIGTHPSGSSHAGEGDPWRAPAGLSVKTPDFEAAALLPGRSFFSSAGEVSNSYGLAMDGRPYFVDWSAEQEMVNPQSLLSSPGTLAVYQVMTGSAVVSPHLDGKALFHMTSPATLECLFDRGAWEKDFGCPGSSLNPPGAAAQPIPLVLLAGTFGTSIGHHDAMPLVGMVGDLEGVAWDAVGVSLDTPSVHSGGGYSGSSTYSVAGEMLGGLPQPTLDTIVECLRMEDGSGVPPKGLVDVGTHSSGSPYAGDEAQRRAMAVPTEKTSIFGTAALPHGRSFFSLQGVDLKSFGSAMGSCPCFMVQSSEHELVGRIAQECARQEFSSAAMCKEDLFVVPTNLEKHYNVQTSDIFATVGF